MKHETAQEDQCTWICATGEGGASFSPLACSRGFLGGWWFWFGES